MLDRKYVYARGRRFRVSAGYPEQQERLVGFVDRLVEPGTGKGQWRYDAVNVGGIVAQPQPTWRQVGKWEYDE